jgi:hypothetical protein
MERKRKQTMKPVILKSDEIVVDQNEFGFLVETFIRDCLRRNNDETWLNEHIHAWWPKIESYYRRQIISNIEVSIALDEPPRYNRRELDNKEMWKKIIKDLREPRSPFTVNYQCSKCKQKGVKLWRDYQTCADYCELECATCLAPDIKVDDEGMHEKKDFGRSDQLNGKVPAIPVDDTYWGYSSVPSQDVEWWKSLSTYPSK